MKRRQKKKASAAPANRLFYLFFGYLFLFLPLFHLNIALDTSLFPRLLALSTLLFVMALVYPTTKAFKETDFGFLRSGLFLSMAGFFALTIVTSFFAHDKREPLFDVVRTLLCVSGFAVSVSIFSKTPAWPEKLTRLATLAALPAIAVGMVQYHTEVIMAAQGTLPDGRALVYAVTGLMSHKNIYSAFMMLLLVFTG